MESKNPALTLHLLPGQSQKDRTPDQLHPDFARLDERTMKDFLSFVKTFSEHIQFYNLQNIVSGNWKKFFDRETDELLSEISKPDGWQTPHLALYITFLKLYEHPQRILNNITGRHLDFFYRTVLQLEEIKQFPDSAHVTFELKKGADYVLLPAGSSMKAGKDSLGKELVYNTKNDLTINRSKVESLRSVFYDESGNGHLYAAPVANSADGLGGKFSDSVQWSCFGNTYMPEAVFGFAIASDVMLMNEGERTLKVELTVSGITINTSDSTVLNSVFEVYLTGKKGWIGPLGCSLSFDKSKNKITLSVSLGQKDDAVVAHDPAVHLTDFDTTLPVARFIFRQDNNLGYNLWKSAYIKTIRLYASVKGMKNLSGENDAGKLNLAKPFLPFGSIPAKGSCFYLDCQEALAKKLSSCSMDIEWKGLPGEGLRSYYRTYDEEAYEAKTYANEKFYAQLKFSDAGGNSVSEKVHLFDSSVSNAFITISSENKITAAAAPGGIMESGRQGMRNVREVVQGLRNLSANELAGITGRVKFNYVPGFKTQTTGDQNYITLTLSQDFLHVKYREVMTTNLLKAVRDETDPVIPNDPYTPEIKSLQFNYEAYSDEISMDSQDITDYDTSEVQFFHIAPFGQMRDHGYQRLLLDFVSDKRVPLFPDFSNEGEFYIGISGVTALDSVSLLLQVSDGSANPDKLKQDISWSVLSGNYWKALGSGDIAMDTTDSLLASGILRIVLPAETVSDNSFLPTGWVWLKAALPSDTDAVCLLVDVISNAVSCEFYDQDNDPQHLATALPAGSIIKLVNGISSIKTISQPFSSFGGSLAEDKKWFYTRVSERLRHKHRAVTKWDFERIVLQEFPKISKVKCLNHTSDESYLAPGYVTIVVVPDTRNKNLTNPLEPKVDLDTKNKVLEKLQTLSAGNVSIHVRNPGYEEIQLSFKVKMRSGYDFNAYCLLINEELKKFLTPWAYDLKKQPEFGGVIYRSVMLDFVEELEYVDYLEDFQMFHYIRGVKQAGDMERIIASVPDSILVSHSNHLISSV